MLIYAKKGEQVKERTYEEYFC
ncbi:hypothetical protein KL86CLO1_10087 [uncultured Eubacteriales bacterium]|uniref:Uncharacterized protein n=1 Tax=uncultured Eubacteriales bacterium TaxID=172733 RepID=A0A212IVH3_9FIRM|nr:hypothetical protein KL86CLO1_10087 [uncultured Eubacteriales bacterium]